MVSWLRRAWQWEWTRAAFVGLINLLIPLFLGLDMVRQRVRHMRGCAESPDKYTNLGRQLVNNLSTWRWCKIFTKINILNELCVGLLVGSKLTYVFFAWLNGWLVDVHYYYVLILVFVIGASFFILPPVPGSAVYIFAGIVLGSKFQENGERDFWIGIGIATIIGLVAKLLACVGQYGIGFYLGTFVSVQKFIGVDAVPTRAIESVLKRPGMDIGKLALLVGGPDWPTSVTCGILRVNVPRMLVGTLPVYVTSIVPQTLAGALFTRDGSTWESVRTGATTFAAVLQAAATLTFTLVTLKVIERDGEELAKPRSEHAAVAELSRRDQAYTLAYDQMLSWRSLRLMQRAVVILAVALQIISGYMLAADLVIGEICFRSFSINDQINKPFYLGGLDNNVINIVLAPWGWAALLIFLSAVSLHICHAQDMSWTAKSSMAASSAASESLS